jgi:carboxypeptidase T
MSLSVLLLASLCVPQTLGAPVPALERDQPVAEAWVSPRSAEDLELIGRAALSSEGSDGTRLRVFATEATLAEIEAAGVVVERARVDHRRGPPGSSGYHSTEAVIQELEALAAAYPERTQLVDLGKSLHGRALLALRIDEGGTKVRVLGTYHGNEPSSTELALATAQAVLGQDPIPDVEIWVMPLVNPDGHDIGGRYNGNGIDLNRNHDYEWSADEYRSGDAPFTEPETRAVRSLSTYANFATGLTLHSGALCIGYAWGFIEDPNSDEDVFLLLHDDYVQANGFADFDTEGLGYLTNGDTNDWAWGRHGTLDFTVEVSGPYSPPEATIPTYNENHWRSIERFLLWTPSFQGTVVDAEDGLPIPATIVPEGRWPSLAGLDGGFARILLESEGTVTVSAPGYQSVEIPWKASEDAAAVLAVALQPSDLLSLRPEPALLDWGDDPVQIELDGVSGDIVLWRPGYPSVEVPQDGAGWAVVPSELAPGPWGITTSEGSAPRSLFVGAWQAHTLLDEASWEGDVVAVEGRGFGRGSRAWLLGGDKRSYTPCPVLSEQDTRLELDVSAAAGLEAPVDLLVFTAGAQLVALDLQRAVEDTGMPGDTGETGEPPQDTGSDTGATSDDTGEGVEPPGGCACSGAAGSVPQLPVLVALLGCLGIRRRR